MRTTFERGTPLVWTIGYAGKMTTHFLKDEKRANADSTFSSQTEVIFFDATRHLIWNGTARL